MVVLKLAFPRAPVFVGILAVLGLGFGISTLVATSQTGDPGSMDRVFAQLYGWAWVLGFGLLLLFGAYQAWKLEPPGRGRGLIAIGVAAIAAGLICRSPRSQYRRA